MKTSSKNIVDIDITITPFTNTLPLRRLDLQAGKRMRIEVVQNGTVLPGIFQKDIFN